MQRNIKTRPLQRLALVSAVAAAVGLSGGLHAQALTREAAQKVERGSEPALQRFTQVNDKGIYIVGLKSAPLALYDGSNGRIGAIPRGDNGRLNVSSNQARSYIAELRSEQRSFLGRLGALAGRSISPIRPDMQFQHAFNGMVLQLSPFELEVLSQMPEVAFIEGYREYPLATDEGPDLIGAPAIWQGIATPNGFRSRGEGVVIGIIDSGMNIASPSFAATDADGYTHTNPLGEGNYLGLCNPTNPNHVPERDICNSKVIGGWDFVDGTANANYEAPGFEDENGHGSHVAATAAGNKRTAVYDGFELELQGVAPRANLVVYDVCNTPPGANGSCPNIATVSAVNQAVADGVVDVINYSISGGDQPWLDATSLAFLAAHNAGVLSVAAAGNDGPDASTTSHQEPWVATVAASTHRRESFSYMLSYAGPGTPPPNTTDLAMPRGAALPINNTLPLVAAPAIVSPGVGTPETDGCSAYPAGTFIRQLSDSDDLFASGFEAGETQQPPNQVGAVAFLRWPSSGSACGTAARANRAAEAGARAVVFLSDSGLLAAGGANIPVFVLEGSSTYDPLLNAIAAAPDEAEVTIPAEAVPMYPPNHADQMADFSSRGPAVDFELVKPDVAAPGSSILAAEARWNRSGAVPGVLVPEAGPAVGLKSGTSMASPHVAGAAALVKAINRSWTPMEIKSALMTTAVQAVRKEDGTTPGDAFDYGAGRIDLTKAAEAGLLFNEIGTNFEQADPAEGGDPSTLNVPSVQLNNCVGTCSVTRRARNARAGVTWTASVEGFASGVTVTPATITPGSGTPSEFTVSVNSAGLPGGEWAFGQIVWTPSNPEVPIARMPLAVRPSLPSISVTPESVSAFAVPDGSATREITVSNVGNPDLNWATTLTGSAPTVFIDQRPPLGTGFQSSEHPANEARSFYTAEDIVLSTDGTLSRISVEGFTLGTGSLNNASAINVRVYADDGGVPNGAPRFDGSNIGAAPVFSASLPRTAPGVIVGDGQFGGRITLDLADAGITSPQLPAGRYWVAVFPTLPGTGVAGSLRWIAAINGTGAALNGLTPVSKLSSDALSWAPLASGGNPVSGIAMTVQGALSCGAPWLSTTPSSGTLGLGASETVTVNFDATGLTPGTYSANLCLSANGSPEAAILPVTFIVPTGDTEPSVSKSFSPNVISPATTSRLTLTLSNQSVNVQSLTAPLVDSFPAGVVIADTPDVQSNCGTPTVTAVPGEATLTVGVGTSIEPISSCTVSVRVVSSTPDTYENVIAIGAMTTEGGSNLDAATAELTVVDGVFPAPYCAINFSVSPDPITLVRVAGIDNPSSPVTGDSPALTDFLSVQGSVNRGSSYPITVKGNTEGNFPYQVVVYADWNNDGAFSETAERTVVGVIQNSTGADALEAVGSLAVPAGAFPGQTRMRVVFQNPTVAGACAGGGFGSAEDYTLIVN